MPSENDILFTRSTGDYPQRTRDNATAGDVDYTISFAVNFSSPGERLTAKVAGATLIPVTIPLDPGRGAVVNADTVARAVGDIAHRLPKRFLEGEPLGLNIAGNSIQTLAEKQVTQAQADEYVTRVLASLAAEGVRIRSIRSGGQTGVDEAGIAAGLVLGVPVTVHGTRDWKWRDADGVDRRGEHGFKERFLVKDIDALRRLTSQDGDEKNISREKQDTMPRKVQDQKSDAGQVNAPAVKPEVPQGLAIDFLNSPDPVTEDESVGKGKYEHNLSENTLKKLDELPWAEISKEIPNLTKENVLKEAKNRYGIAEAFAYGSYTKYPMYLTFGGEHEKKMGKWCTINLWHRKGENGEMKWGYEVHPVSKKYVYDKDGKQVYENGKPKVTWDVNPIKPGDILYFNGQQLNPEQVDQLRLTGSLSEPITAIDSKGKPQQIVVGVDKYNNHCLVALYASIIFQRLSAVPKVKISANESVELTPKQIGELSIGHGIWLKTQDKQMYFKYDVFEEKLRPKPEYNYALKQELAQKEAEAIKKEAGITQGQERTQGQGRGIR